MLLCFIDISTLSQYLGACAQVVGIGVGASALFLNLANYRKIKKNLKDEKDI